MKSYVLAFAPKLPPSYVNRLELRLAYSTEVEMAVFLALPTDHENGVVWFSG